MTFEVVYKDESLEQLERDAKCSGGHSAAVVKAFRKRMWSIRNAVDERDLRESKGNHFEKLKGDREHQHSMKLNDQWRLIVEIDGKGANKRLVVIEIEDYH
jgi:proteic killer suppression protein